MSCSMESCMYYTLISLILFKHVVIDSNLYFLCIYVGDVSLGSESSSTAQQTNGLPLTTSKNYSG